MNVSCFITDRLGGCVYTLVLTPLEAIAVPVLRDTT